MDWFQAFANAFGMILSVAMMYIGYTVISHNDYLSSFLPGGYKKFYHLRTATTTFEDIIGHDLIKKDLQETLNGKNDIRGFIFSGMSGTGKTMMARAVANYAKDKIFVEIYADTLESDLVVRTIDHVIKNHVPVVIYIDECHNILSKFSTYFLRKLDGFDKLDQVLFICATNDPIATNGPIATKNALIRTGRFKQYKFETPTYEGRKRWFEKYRPQDDITILLANSEGLTYADLASVPTELSASAVLSSNLGFTTEKATFNEEQIRRIAYHEVGHFIMALLCKHASDPLMCSLENNGPIGGLNIISLKTIYTFEQLQALIMILLGGRLAERYLTGTTSTLFEDDAEKIEILLKTMEKNRMIGKLYFGNRGDYITHLESEIDLYYDSLGIDVFQAITDRLIQKTIITVDDISDLIPNRHTFMPKLFVPTIKETSNK